MDFQPDSLLPPLRTNSDSALHTSALSTKAQDPYGGGGQSAWPASYMGKTRRPTAISVCAFSCCPVGTRREKLKPCARVFSGFVIFREKLLAEEMCVLSVKGDGACLLPLPLHILFWHLWAPKLPLLHPVPFSGHRPFDRDS